MPPADLPDYEWKKVLNLSAITNSPLVGNVTGDPELKFTQNGAGLLTFSVAVNERYKDDDGNWQDKPPMFFDVKAWRNPAERAADVLEKGSSVVLLGKWVQETWETDDGKRSKVVFEANTIAINTMQVESYTRRAPQGDGPRSNGNGSKPAANKGRQPARSGSRRSFDDGNEPF
jgi:single-strand DNA-binding protein